jgi:endonuclease/exonuclease/phosphatase family metal-dependent hydrolase
VHLPSQRSEQGIRVMTYNIRSGNGALDSTAAEIRSLSPDIVALQEVDVHWDARSGFADQATLLGEKLAMHVCFAPIYKIPSAIVGAPVREFGVALLSKYPLVSCDNRVITRLSTQQQNPVPALMSGFLDAVLVIGGRKVHVYDTHLDYRADPSVRRQQVADMLAYFGGASVPMMLMGDLNAEPTAPELAPLFARLHDAWSANGGTGLTYPAEDPKKRIDYVLVSDQFRARSASVPATVASDHRPVVADLVLAER